MIACADCQRFVHAIDHRCPGRPGRRRVTMKEPAAAERGHYRRWLDRHRTALGRAHAAAEDLSRAYDQAALVTSADGNPEIPPALKATIDDLYARWEAVRWAGQRSFRKQS